jgi:hypothetical protein
MDADELKEEIEHQKGLIKAYRKRLRILERQAAGFGALYVPTHIQTEIDDLMGKIEACKKKIEYYKQELHDLDKNTSSAIINQDTKTDLDLAERLISSVTQITDYERSDKGICKGIYFFIRTKEPPSIRDLHKQVRLNIIKIDKETHSSTPFYNDNVPKSVLGYGIPEEGDFFREGRNLPDI